MASTTTDRANKWKTMTMDVFGNLATVTRTQRSRSHNKLITVSMPRDGITRTFNYNCQLQLTSVVQPENGTTSYTYNTDKTAATKTDAKGQIAAYTYDSLKRVIQITRSTSVGNPVACCADQLLLRRQPRRPQLHSICHRTLGHCDHGKSLLHPRPNHRDVQLQRFRRYH